ncbi:MAG: ParA family protein [Hyphomicrobium sp.]|nr:ParA family protein [Hyphomicrobium sp.]
MRKIAVANLKGGVGKSTTTLFLSEHWSHFHNLRVLVIDLDPQANSSYMLLSRDGVEHAEKARQTLPHLFEDLGNGGMRNAMSYVVLRASDVKEINDRTRRALVSVVPSMPRVWFQQHDFDRAAYIRGRDPTTSCAILLADFCREVEGQYDCVVFDCPPGFGTLARAALQLADIVIAPTIADYTSMRSLQDFATLGLSHTLQLDPTRQMYVVVSKFTGTIAQKQALDVLTRSYRVVPHPIPMRDQVQLAAERQSTKQRTYASKYERPLYRPLKPYVKGMSDWLHDAIFNRRVDSD